MVDYKAIIGAFAVALTFIGYFPYVRDIFNKKTRPHVFSWLIWTVVTGILYALQVSAGAGPGSWANLSVFVILLFIFFLSLPAGRRDIKKIDIVFLVIALLVLPLWLLTKQPVLSVILLTSIDLLAFLPTVRKSWNDPHSETLSFYLIIALWNFFSFLAMAEYNLVTYLSPVVWVVADVSFAVMLFVRRKRFFALSR